ncbi:MAG: carboxymuconolactone decarboxylase family protein [Myxococcales bacterium]|nr:carboxymuconolactone decarboxylase family protein [Myxococcales bacterium]
MLISAMSVMMERMSPSSVHILEPDSPHRAKGLQADVYKQMRRDFMIAAPFVLHAPEPRLLAAVWGLVRETLFTGDVARGDKEIIASAVSEANECPYCVGAHEAAVHAASAEDPELEAWSKATGWAHSPELAEPPFEASGRAEHYGTVVAFHYLNRMVSVFLDDKMMPMPNFMDRVTNFMATIMMGGMIRRSNRPGESASLLPDYDASLAWCPDWAKEEGAEHIATALSGWSGTIEELAREQVPEAVRTIIGGKIDRWDGTAPMMGDQWLDDMRGEDFDEALVATADLALLTAMAPYRVTDDRIQDVVDAGASKEDALVIVAWAAQRAARRSGDWLQDAYDKVMAAPTATTETPLENAQP